MKWNIILLYTVALLVHGYPKDDFWRHLRGNYKGLYFDSYLPDFNLWLGYDWIVQSVGEYAYMLLYIIISLLFSIAFIRETKDSPERTQVLFLSIFLWLILGRIETARPTVLTASMVAFAFSLRKESLTLFVGSLTIPLYWLSSIHLVPLAIRYKRGFLLIPASLFFWLIYSKGEFIEVFINLLILSEKRDILIGENLNPAFFLFKLSLALIPVLFLLENKQLDKLKQEKDTILSALFFILPMQVRYFMDGSVFFLMTLSKHLPGVPKTLSFLAIMLVFFSPLSKETYKDFPQLKGNVLIAEFNQPNFELSYRLKEAKVSPPMEIKWADKAVYETVKSSILEGKIDCIILCKTQADFLVERNLKQIPNCLKLYGIYKEHRIWRIECGKSW